MTEPSLHDVLPVNDAREHVETGIACWCHLRLTVLCDECVDDPACWKCGGKGLVDATVPSDAQIVVHNALDGRK